MYDKLIKSSPLLDFFIGICISEAGLDVYHKFQANILNFVVYDVFLTKTYLYSPIMQKKYSGL